MELKKDESVERAIRLAEQLLVSALQQQSRSERAEAAKLGRMLNDSEGKAFTLGMVDRVFRSRRAVVRARQWRSTLERYGIPRYMPFLDRCLLRIGAAASYLFPDLVMRSVEARMRSESARVILPGERGRLDHYLAERTREGFRINLNHLGEAVLGDEEATNRLTTVLTHLANPAVNYVSVKISAIYSQVSLIAWDETLYEIKARLRRLYGEALKSRKFVNLDMEEYRDLQLTVTAFREVLDEPEFRSLSAGVVLQAYLPDSFIVQREITEWARLRIANGGASIKLRLVKGANLAMEKVEAEIRGWNPAPYATKAETDANFRRMLEFGCMPENAKAVRLGVASHNLFDVALALTLREQSDVNDRVEIEMLEGMANHQARAVRDAVGSLLLYAPAVQQDDFLSAMSYLVRRLDENTAPENFLREMFAMLPGSAEWNNQRSLFLRGWYDRNSVASASRRATPAVQPSSASTFVNEPETDWSQPAARAALKTAIKEWQSADLPSLPLLDEVLKAATQAHPTWEKLRLDDRAGILNRAAEIMSDQRFIAIACLRVDGNKAIAEADNEVTEAIDFARYYARNASVPNGLKSESLGIVAVVSPWNFPYAIPAGGVLAALMAGNCVVLKPARATQQIAWLLVNQLWRAGVPREVLHFFPCDNTIGSKLIADPRIASVVLTGSYETARKFQEMRPTLPLLAETSGKNAMIITAQSDRELAIKDLVRSAFGHSGQKCSAASLAILEAEVYDDLVFRRQLRDATKSLHVGPATDARSILTPLVVAPSENLLRALTTLDEGESWLLEPKLVSAQTNLWSPGIRLAVQPGSWFHRTECFGPVLGLMRADSLSQAIGWQNATDYGLTAGIHSLDESELASWRERVQAGNLYINRPITGAIVQRQPFGGWKRSSIGPGAKAGGPNYVRSFYRITSDEARENNFQAVWTRCFSIEQDPSSLRAESNVFRYRPCRGVILRLDTREPYSIELAQLAANITRVPLTISLRQDESDEEFISRLPKLALQAEFLRTIAAPTETILRAVYEVGLNWINAPILANGEIELTRWLREQSISESLHRYGQISERPDAPYR